MKNGAGRAFSSGDDIVGGVGGERSPEPAERIARSVARGPHYRLIKAMAAPRDDGQPGAVARPRA
jgi:hypothetical protein